jgi:hypothetical protein
LADLKRVKYTILEAKSQFYMPEFRVIEFIYDILERYPNTFKIIKIIKWFFLNDITEVRVFIRIVIYYKIFIKNFAVIAASIYFLIKKKIRFTWDTE